ncbi:hypothetical protein MASR1M101_39390 [Gemmatimonas sp.]
MQEEASTGPCFPCRSGGFLTEEAPWGAAGPAGCQNDTEVSATGLALNRSVSWLPGATMSRLCNNENSDLRPDSGVTRVTFSLQSFGDHGTNGAQYAVQPVRPKRWTRPSANPLP